MTTFIQPLVIFIIIIKILFAIFLLSNLFFEHIQHNKEYEQKTRHWKERTEFIFIFSMAILLLILFYPRGNNIRFITFEIKILICIFAIILLITPNWNMFITDPHSIIFKHFII